MADWLKLDGKLVNMDHVAVVEEDYSGNYILRFGGNIEPITVERGQGYASDENRRVKNWLMRRDEKARAAR